MIEISSGEAEFNLGSECRGEIFRFQLLPVCGGFFPATEFGKRRGAHEAASGIQFGGRGFGQGGEGLIGAVITEERFCEKKLSIGLRGGVIFG